MTRADLVRNILSRLLDIHSKVHFECIEEAAAYCLSIVPPEILGGEDGFHHMFLQPPTDEQTAFHLSVAEIHMVQDHLIRRFNCEIAYHADHTDQQTHAELENVKNYIVILPKHVLRLLLTRLIHFDEWELEEPLVLASRYCPDNVSKVTSVEF